MFYDKIQICEDHLIDLSNDEFEGCPVCEMQSEINRLKKIIKELKTPTEPADQEEIEIRQPGYIYLQSEKDAKRAYNIK